MPYTVIMNTPGYLPWDDDEPPVFDTAREAWSYLAEQRRSQEDDSTDSDTYSDTVDTLEMRAVNGGDGTVYGSTPGYDGDHDLGVAYSVTEVEG